MTPDEFTITRKELSRKDVQEIVMIVCRDFPMMRNKNIFADSLYVELRKELGGHNE